MALTYLSDPMILKYVSAIVMVGVVLNFFGVDLGSMPRRSY